MKDILFVDDEPMVLNGLRRMLRELRNEWNMDFASGGAQALEKLAQSPVDVVVTDMRMPGMSGAELLTEVMRLYPQTVRIILSGQSDRDTTIKSVGPAHQFLAKPCDSEVVKATVARACALRDQLADESLKRVTSCITTLPSLPSTYREIMRAVQSTDVRLTVVGEIISRDVAMTAMILHLVNSAFFGLPRAVGSPAQAVTLLGLDTVRALVLSVGVFSQFDGSGVPGYSVEALTHHSLSVAFGAKAIAECEGAAPRFVDDAFMAGMLHDIGQLVFVGNLPERYQQALNEAAETQCPLWKTEKQLLGATHGEVGGYLMGLWGLPDAVVESCIHHHTPSQGPAQEFSVLTAVHAADCLTRERTDERDWEGDASLDLEHLQRVGKADRLSEWRDACRDCARGGQLT